MKLVGGAESQGRLKRKVRLKPGRYKVIARATDAASNHSERRTASFKIVARRAGPHHR